MTLAFRLFFLILQLTDCMLPHLDMPGDCGRMKSNLRTSSVEALQPCSAIDWKKRQKMAATEDQIQRADWRDRHAAYLPMACEFLASNEWVLLRLLRRPSFDRIHVEQTRYEIDK